MPTGRQSVQRLHYKDGRKAAHVFVYTCFFRQGTELGRNPP